MRAYTFDRAEFGFGLLILAFIFFELSIEVTDDDEIRVLGCHELIIPPGEVGHLGN
jgi:hypothetical protein